MTQIEFHMNPQEKKNKNNIATTMFELRHAHNFTP